MTNSNDIASYIQVVKREKYDILKKNNEFFIITYGLSININEITEDISRNHIHVTNFLNIRSAIKSRFNEILPFGIEKEKIIVTISNDKMKAYVDLEMTQEEWEKEPDVFGKMSEALKKHKIVYGLKLEKIKKLGQIPTFTNLLVAEGKYPIDGKNSTIKLMSLTQNKPKELENGLVDHFEMGIINNVNVDDWLGEWTKPTDGEIGINILGEKVKAKNGMLLKIPYDKKTVREVDQGEKISIYAKRSGVIKIEHNGMISILNHFIAENVDYNTGNIDFMGHVTVNGTVADGFSVIATEDIDIKGEEGIGCVKQICSHNGNVRISGGVNGRGKTIIKGNNISARYISNASVISENLLIVKNYILSSIVTAKEIVMEGPSTQIAGGEISGASRIVVGSLGNRTELKTIINLSEVNREQLNKSMQELSNIIEENKIKIFNLDKVLSDSIITENDVEKLLREKTEMLLMNRKLEKDFLSCKRAISMKGESQIKIYGCVYPEVQITSKGERKVFLEKTMLSSIYTKSGIIVLD